MFFYTYLILKCFFFLQVIRVMPNTPSLVQEGATVYAKGRNCSPNDGLLAQNIFHAVGPACFEVSESWIDAITGISGSGPAYMYIIIGKYVTI